MTKYINLTGLFCSFFALWLLFALGCREEESRPFCPTPYYPGCPEYDPCFLSKPASSRFVMFDSISQDTFVGVVSDTFFSDRPVYFKALDRVAVERYEWQFGTDPTFRTGPERQLYFYDFNGDVTVRLVTQVKPNSDCLSPVELSDTVYQTLTVIDRDEARMLGTYTGADEDNPSQQYEITVTGWNSDYWKSYVVSGIPLECSYPLGVRYVSSSNFLVSVHSFNEYRCRSITVFALLKEDHKTLHLYYSYNRDDGRRVRKKFIGYRQ